MRNRKALIVFGLIAAFFACKNEKKQHASVDTISSPKVSNTTIDSTKTAKTKVISKPEKPDENQLESLNEGALNKIYIPLERNDSSLYLTAEMKSDHRIFGYAKPNKKSERLILFSIFTNEVEGNPFKCKYGSYYDINKGSQNFSLKYTGQKDNFISALLTDSTKNTRNVYFEKKWIEIE